MDSTDRRVFGDLLLAQILLHTTTRVSAQDSEVSIEVLELVAAAGDAVARALAKHVEQREIPPDCLEALADEIVRQTFGPTTTS